MPQQALYKCKSLFLLLSKYTTERLVTDIMDTSSLPLVSCAWPPFFQSFFSNIVVAASGSALARQQLAITEN